MDSYTAAPGVEVITSNFPIPGYGFVPINAFVLRGTEPILVDTGSVVDRAQFLPALRKVIDPGDLRWLYLTHTDPDHIGSLTQLVSENPRLRVITTFLGLGIMSLQAPLPMDRVYLLNPGETLALSDRTLTCLRPPVYDNPSTTCFYDDRTRILFSADCFGALLADPAPHSAAELKENVLRDGQHLWATIDSPWLHKVKLDNQSMELDLIRRMAPALILSSHLPAASAALTDRMLSNLAGAPGSAPFIGPNQAGLQKMLEQLSPIHAVPESHPPHSG